MRTCFTVTKVFLTSRKHGVATIWLVATLGSKSALKKVSRRAILDVDVSKACQTIADPESPMALRLQSSLLYGVSRVFSQQCGYILTDMQSLRDKMRGISLVIRDLQIDRDVALTSDKLNLSVDPGLDFEFGLGFDTSAFDIASQSIGQSSLLSPHSLVSTKSSLIPEEEVEPQLLLPSADTPGYDMFNFNLDEGVATSSAHRPFPYGASDLDEPGIDANPLFEITEDGMLIDKSLNEPEFGDFAGSVPLQATDNKNTTPAPISYDSVALANVQTAAEANLDDDYIVMGDEDYNTVLPTDHASISATAAASTAAGDRATTAPPDLTGHEPEEAETTAEAPHRKARAVRVLQVDQITELTNRELSRWQNEYLDTMAQAQSERIGRKSLAQARRNAAFWVLEQGIGGAAINFGNDREVHPLAAFSGDSLLNFLTGTQYSVVGRKRSHSSIESEEEDGDDQSRRRRTASEQNVGRGNEQVGMMHDDDGMLFGGDDEIEIQMGRQRVSSLKDHPSSMPWNLMNSSKQGSVRGSALPEISSSIHGLGIVRPSSVFSGRRSRLTSASPLFGKGQPVSRLASLEPQRTPDVFDIDTGDFADPFEGLTGGIEDDFELYGPAAVVSTQQAAQSQWLAATLENEAYNFLVFLNEKISNEQDADEDATRSSITFAKLLPPEQNSNIVAAQGLLHVLALATKGLIEVEQQVAFDDIAISIIPQPNEEAAPENVDVEDAEPTEDE